MTKCMYRDCKEYKIESEREEHNNRSACYITTIVCDILNKSDNCYELNTLRQFRDNYMLKNKNYLKLLLEYEFVGPLIASCIKRDQNKERLASYIFGMHILPTVSLIKENKLEDAIKSYVFLVKTLIQYYQIQVPNIDYEKLVSELPNELDKHVVRSFVKKIYR